MAQFTADILLKVISTKAEEAVKRLTQQVDRLNDAVASSGYDKAFGKITNSASKARQSVNKLAQSFEKFGSLGAVAGVGGLGVALNEVASAAANASATINPFVAAWNAAGTAIHNVTGFLDPLNAALHGLGPSGQAAAAGIGIATTALMAFAPQVEGVASTALNAGRSLRGLGEAAKDNVLGNLNEDFKLSKQAIQALDTSAAGLRKTIADLTKEQQKLYADSSAYRNKTVEILNAEELLTAELTQQAAVLKELKLLRTGSAFKELGLGNAFEPQQKLLPAFQERGLQPLTQGYAEALRLTQERAAATQTTANVEAALSNEVTRGTRFREKSAEAAQRIQDYNGKILQTSDGINQNMRVSYRTLVGWSNALRTGNKWLKEDVSSTEALRKANQQVLSADNARIQAKKTLAKLTKEETAATQRNGKIGNAVSSALIGGGFPLLFGQGGAAAGGGAIGGLAGGLLGGGFGFALSVIGTALGQALEDAEKFDRSINALNGSLSGASSSIRITAGDVSDLARQLSITNEEAVDLLATFSAFDSPAAIQELAKGFSNVGGVRTAEQIAQSAKDERSTLEAIDRLRTVIGNKTASQLLKQLELEGSQAASAALLDAVLSKQQDINVETAKTVNLWDRILSAFALSSGAVGIDPNELTPEAIAEDRAAGIKEANKRVIDTALDGLERFYKERDRLAEKYKPERKGAGGAGDRAAKEAERQARVLAGLRAQLQTSSQLLAIDKQIAAAKIAGQEQKVRELEINRATAESAGKVALIKTRGLAEAEQQLRIQLEEHRLEKALLDIDTKRALERQKIQESFEKTVAGLEIELASAKALTREEETRLKLAKLRLELEGKGFDDAQIAKIQDLNAALLQTQQPLAQYTTELKRSLLDTEGQIVQLAQAIEQQLGSAMSSAVTGLVTGTQTVEQAMASMFENIGKAFIDMATQMIAKALVLKVLGVLGGGSSNMGGSGYYDSMTGLGTAGPNFGLADGGSVNPNGVHLVGEQGPELFVPGQAGMVVPNDIFEATRQALTSGGGTSEAFSDNSEALALANSYTRERMFERERQTMMTGAGGSTTVQTQVINSVEYATIDQVQQVADLSAKKARAQVFSDMRNRPATRASLGMG